jgi:hypothetical protein
MIRVFTPSVLTTGVAVAIDELYALIFALP